MLRCSILLIFVLLNANHAFSAMTDQQLRIVGSATVFPFTALVAEYYTKSSNYPSPVTESNGTGGGIHQFCQGVGSKYPDIVNASRPMKENEKELCAANGIQDVFEIIIGYDGLVIANQNGVKPFKLNSRDLWFALAEKIPTRDGFVVNPYLNWQEIKADFQRQPILLLGPPPSSGTRETFVKTIMEKGCPDLSSIIKGNEIELKHQCGTIREDGLYADVGENDNLTIQKLLKNKNALGLIRYGYYEQNKHLIQAAQINGTLPTRENIKSNRYLPSRKLYLYVKKPKQQKKEILHDFLSLYLSDNMIGVKGKLEKKGLIALSKKDRIKNRMINERIFNSKSEGVK